MNLDADAKLTVGFTMLLIPLSALAAAVAYKESWHTLLKGLAWVAAWTYVIVAIILIIEGTDEGDPNE